MFSVTGVEAAANHIFNMMDPEKVREVRQKYAIEFSIFSYEDLTNAFNKSACIKKEYEVDDEELYNLSHVIYEATGCIMPRKLDRYLPALQILDRYRIKGKKNLLPLLYCMTLLGKGKYQSKMNYGNQCVDDFGDAEADIEAASEEELKSEIKSLRAELSRMKQQVYDSSGEARDQKARYEVMAQKGANEAQELHDLRELVYNQQNNLFDDHSTATGIDFPYRTDRRIVVFGGHDSWSKEMKPKFPDVRFIDRTMLQNTDLIRKAEVILVQTNAIAHSHYYKIIDEVRKYGIPLRYFTYSGVGKCAEQIVNDDVNRM